MAGAYHDHTNAEDVTAESTNRIAICCHSPSCPAQSSSSLTPRLSIPPLPDSPETLPWAQHVTKPTMIWATTSALSTMTWLLQCSVCYQELMWNSSHGQSGRTIAELPLPRALGTLHFPVRPQWTDR